MAYIPKLDDTIHDTYKRHFDDKPSAEILTHLRRGLIQAVWRLLLDDEFMDAYENGIEILFHDGVYRRVFPHFFTYSADYPEKLIYEKGYSVTSTAVKDLLDEKSWTATRNAFSDRLSPHGFDFYSMFAVDLLHEFELGVWKATFTHLMRILFAGEKDSLQVLNARYRLVPPFGRAIRRFSSNASAMKKLAARDFEDLLQCAIPVFEGLLGEPHDQTISNLLFELATWHGLAKLRLHTTSTIAALEASTTRLGNVLREFESTTCKDFETVDLPSEEAARARRRKGKQTTTTSNAKSRKFNLETYKLHALGDYAQTIRRYGPTDGFSTQIGEVEHRRCKQFYPRVHKGKKYYAVGIAKQVSHQRVMHNRGQVLGIQMARPNKKKRLSPTTQRDIVNEGVRSNNASVPYLISDETRNPIRISSFLSTHAGDPAVKDFLPRLRDHVLGRLLNQRYDGDDNPFSDADRAEVLFRNHTMFEHKTLRVNYTTYDMRREQDTLNSRTNANIMMLSPDGEHPYWYAKIIGIFHVLVSHRDLQPTPKPMNFLWVRWYGMDPGRGYRFGWKARKLPRIGFVDGTDDDPLASPPFGFIDPAHVIRSVHLIPAFHHGHTSGLLGPSALARLSEDDQADWNFFYVNVFADRDMVMRFRGGGVGHHSTRQATDRFLTDRPSNDTHWSLQQAHAPEESSEWSGGDDEPMIVEGVERALNVVGGEEDEVDESEVEEFGYGEWEKQGEETEEEADEEVDFDEPVNEDERDVEGEFSDMGATITRFANTRESALKILDMGPWANDGNTNVGATVSLLYQDLHERIQGALQQKEVIRSELAHLETQTNSELRALLEKHHAENEEILKTFVEDIVMPGFPPPGFEDAHYRLLTSLLGTYIPLTLSMRTYVLRYQLTRLVRNAKRRGSKWFKPKA
ncbi:hypothetical protein BJ165DRAFT_1615947 [Panaeolus papilionaceus]|nr:hypothetical protein BJ165DRAFT_1615947 [Panaeolus papilionaceus]